MATAPATSPYSPSLQTLYSRRDYIRSMLDASAASSRANNAKTTSREISSINQGRGGIYSSAGVSGALRNAAQASGARSRGYLENQIARTRAGSEMDLSGDIAGQYDHEENRRQGYAYAAAQGRSAKRAQDRAQMMQVAGLLGTAAIAFL
jgi:hypothetical protein